MRKISRILLFTGYALAITSLFLPWDNTDDFSKVLISTVGLILFAVVVIICANVFYYIKNENFSYIILLGSGLLIAFLPMAFATINDSDIQYGPLFMIKGFVMVFILIGFTFSLFYSMDMDERPLFLNYCIFFVLLFLSTSVEHYIDILLGSYRYVGSSGKLDIYDILKHGFYEVRLIPEIGIYLAITGGLLALFGLGLMYAHSLRAVRLPEYKNKNNLTVIYGALVLLIWIAYLILR